MRIEGKIKKTPADVSLNYFRKRPLESRLSSIVSPQSQVIDSLSSLKKKAEELFVSDKKLSMPVNWGGYELTPEVIEFWQGGKSRLHDRIRYSKKGYFWFTDRLAP